LRYNLIHDINMKKSLIILSLCSLVPMFSLAQVESPNSIGIGIGIITAPDFIEYAQPTFKGPTFGLITESSKISTPAFMFEYNRALGEHLDMGFSIVYQQYTTKYSLLGVSALSAGQTQTHFLSIMPQFRFHYIPIDSWLGLYSGGAIGVNYQVIDARDIEDVIESEGNIGFSWQVTAIGAEVGNKFGAHAELGFGFKGIISAGIHARF
jgi:hypothetical protein